MGSMYRYSIRGDKAKAGSASHGMGVDADRSLPSAAAAAAGSGESVTSTRKNWIQSPISAASHWTRLMIDFAFSLSESMAGTGDQWLCT
jgi:hypothetical protein